VPIILYCSLIVDTRARCSVGVQDLYLVSIKTLGGRFFMCSVFIYYSTSTSARYECINNRASLVRRLSRRRAAAPRRRASCVNTVTNCCSTEQAKKYCRTMELKMKLELSHWVQILELFTVLTVQCGIKLYR
jgi:hypothetical protein